MSEPQSPDFGQQDLKVCAVVVAHNPGNDLNDRLVAIRRQVDRILVVDNGSNPESQAVLERIARIQFIDLIRNPTNEGVATALNQGIRHAREEGFSWVLTLDQDSEPSPKMIHEQLDVYFAQMEPDRVAIVAPQVIDADIGRRAPFLRRGFGPFYRRDRCDNSTLRDVTTVITSGALVRLSVIEAIGGFREDFFIDYVDTEFCLRALRSGYRIVVACRAELYHRLGDRRKTKIGPFSLYPTFHSPERWYSISRNRIPMLRMYAFRFPHWLTYELVAALFTIFRMLLAEDQRAAKVRAIVQGTVDGIRGRMGKPPTAQIL
ncbi:MAG: glycosyltransferase family 2 protein [Anaerolineales bacterium]